MELSKRLHMVASMVEPGSRVADVGCDHGYVAIHLVESGVCPWVLAMDVNRGPLERAREHIREAGLSSQIQVRLSDGLHAMEWKEGKPEADTLLCAGIGGRLACRIMEESREKLAAMCQVILQPQSELWLVRQALCRAGYFIIDENMIKEEGKFYTVMKAVNAGLLPHPDSQACGRGVSGWSCVPEGEYTVQALREPEDGAAAQDSRRIQECLGADWQEAADRFGGKLILSRHPVLREYLCEGIRKNRSIREGIVLRSASRDGAVRLQDLERETALMQKTLAAME